MPGQPKEKHRECMRKWRALNPESVRETQRKWVLANREKNAQRKREYNAKNAQKISEAKKIYRQVHAVELAAYKKKYDSEHRLQINAYFRRWYAKGLSLRIAKEDPERVMRAVSQAVNSMLPRFMRDDVMGEMFLAVYAGELLLANVAARVRSFITGHNRQYDNFKTLSLDAPMGGSDLRRIDLLEAPAAYEPEEDEYDYGIEERRSPSGIIIPRR